MNIYSLNEKNSSRLLEVDFVRPILILLLVFYHAFIIYDNGWVQPLGYRAITLYKWLDKFSYSFMLETFVMISGYIFGHQIIGKKMYQQCNFKTGLLLLIKKKISRLLIPSVIFSLLYLSIFYYYLESSFNQGNDLWHKTFTSPAYLVVSGAGHLWFLPMLFWCFIFGFILYKMKINIKIKILISISLISFSVFFMPFQINMFCSYFFYFYMGIILYTRRDFLLKDRKKMLCMMWGLFLVVFLLQSYLSSNLFFVSHNNIIENYLMKEVEIYIISLRSFLGCFALMFTAFYVTSHKSIPKWFSFISPYCFGVYIFQQFIIKWLNEKTSLYVALGPIFSPWFSFLFALILSLLLSWAVIRTNIGKRLIG